MAEKRLVWDLPVRLFHWLLVASLLASWLTREFETRQYHMWIGYWTIGLVVFRILWGFVGPRHARFSDFLVSPSKFAGYASGLFRRDSKPAVGHNPVGGVMVIVMLLVVLAQAVSGLFISDDIVWSGPYYEALGSKFSSQMGWLHHANFDVLVWIIGLHVLAILFYAFWKRQDLVRPMFTGHKDHLIVPEQESITGSEWLKALIVAAICAGGVWAMLEFAPEPPPAEEYDY
jgi:cytochrome b